MFLYYLSVISFLVRYNLIGYDLVFEQHFDLLILIGSGCTHGLIFHK